MKDMRFLVGEVEIENKATNGTRERFYLDGTPNHGMIAFHRSLIDGFRQTATWITHNTSARSFKSAGATCYVLQSSSFAIISPIRIITNTAVISTRLCLAVLLHYYKNN